MFETLVVALDGSLCADRALELALQLAKAGSSKLALCSVADPALEGAHTHAQRIVDEALTRAQAAGVEAGGAVLDGEPVYEIVSYAQCVGAGGIVIGTHGRSGIRRLLMGSVAEGVLRSAPVPILTVRAQANLTESAAEVAS